MDKKETPETRYELIKDLNRSYGLGLTDRLSAEGLETGLAERLNALILSDFNALLSILYRVDVNEARLRELLKANEGENAGKIMARLIIERQGQKMQTRKEFGNPQGEGEGTKGGNVKGAGDWQDV
jgi:hypothetical protein